MVATKWSLCIAVILWMCLLSVQHVESNIVKTKVDQTGGILSRIQRDTPRDECIQSDVFWDIAESFCRVCTKCPSGYESTAKYCGYGLGERGICIPCPDGYYRSLRVKDQTCRPCSSCDPDALVKANCSASADTQCGSCKPGMYNTSGYCVSCRDHPNEEKCGAESTPGIHTTTGFATTSGTTATTTLAVSGSDSSTPPTPPDCPNINQTATHFGAQRVIPREVEDVLCAIGGFFLCVLLVTVYRWITNRERCTDPGESTKPSPEGECLIPASPATNSLPNNNTAVVYLANNGDVELGPVESPPPQVVIDTQTPAPLQKAETRDAGVQADDEGQQETQPIKERITTLDQDDPARVPLSDQKQRATPFTTMTSQSSGPRPRKKNSSGDSLLKGVLLPQNRRDSVVGTDDEVDDITDTIRRQEANPAMAGGACGVETPTDSANYSGSTSVTSSVSWGEEINQSIADPPEISADVSSNDTLQRPKGSITDTSIWSDDSEDTVIYKGCDESEIAVPSPPGLRDEEMISNNVAMPLDFSVAQSSYGSLRSLDDIPMKRHSERDMMMDEVQKAEEKSKEYHVDDLGEKIIRELGLKLNPERGPAFQDAKSLAVSFRIDSDVYNNFKREYFFQDLIMHLKRESPGKFRVYDLLQKLIEIKCCDVALALAVHVNTRKLKKACLTCKLSRDVTPLTVDNSHCRDGNNVGLYETAI